MPAFALAGLSLMLAVVTGVAWLGKPLRTVNLLTIIGLGMTTGVSWAQAVWRARQERAGSNGDAVVMEREELS
jgi:uncharacterized membrane protein